MLDARLPRLHCFHGRYRSRHMAHHRKIPQRRRVQDGEVGVSWEECVDRMIFVGCANLVSMIATRTMARSANSSVDAQPKRTEGTF